MEKININLLIIDDEPTLLRVLSSTLSHFVNQVTAVECSLEGFKFFEEKHNNIDLVITDLNMPKLNGYDLITKIREICKDTLIYISSGDDFNLDEYSKTLNIKRKIDKPTSVDIILESIKQDFP